jgi:hypothetical protein
MHVDGQYSQYWMGRWMGVSLEKQLKPEANVTNEIEHPPNIG